MPGAQLPKHVSGVPKRGRRTRAMRAGAGSCLLWLGCMPALAAPPPHLGIKPHTVSPRYAYAVSGRSLQVQRDCKQHRGLLRLDVQVINRGATRIDLPVRLRVRWPASGHMPLWVDVPDIAPGHSAWVRVDLPYAVASPPTAPVSLQLALTAAGQSWNRLRLPAPAAAAPCPEPSSHAVAHTREVLR